jgi:hypothetical protein
MWQTGNGAIYTTLATWQKCNEFRWGHNGTELERHTGHL